ncbi:DUF3124 domain-containing protein [Stappia sp.]|uniref:DUF3124 domain-containing protein n=1 Tax=Stappia sp. TaxID=1870903 RepID=UPI0032D990BC
MFRLTALLPTRVLAASFAVAVAGWTAAAGAQDSLPCSARATAETIYLPAYSEVPSSDRGRVQFASTVLVHNVDPDTDLVLTRVSYHDASGAKVRDMLGEETPLAPFASFSAVVDVTDRSGGIGANFIIEWRAETASLSPIAEAVMLGSRGTQGFAIGTEGRTIRRTPAPCPQD